MPERMDFRSRSCRSQLSHLHADSPNEICAASCAQAVQFALDALADERSHEQ